MPPQPLASFASAAASNGASESSSNGRGVTGSGEWGRPRTNGATATFRRSSQANTSAQPRDISQSTSGSTSNVYVPPHANIASQPGSRPGGNEMKYSREQLLDMFKALSSIRDSNESPSDILTEGWIPGASVGGGNGSWGRRDDSKEGQVGPDICWDATASVKPLGLIAMDDEERELFSTTVNSPLKPPPQNTNKEAAQGTGINGRKQSISQVQSTSSAVQSGRPGTRRRETSDTVPANPLTSPTAFNRASREESSISTPPPSLMRRRTDIKDLAATEKKIETGLETSSPFGSFKRTATGPLSAGLNGPSSPWSAGPQSAGFGAFGNFSIEGSAGQGGTPGEKKLGFGSIRGESRFKGLMSKDSSEDIGSKSKERAGLSLLERLGETDNDDQSSKWGRGLPGKDLDQIGEQRVGSAALGGDDSSPPQRTFSGMDQRLSQDEIGFSRMGREQIVHETSQGLHSGHFEGSPTGTNPYQSPEGDGGSEMPNEAEDESPSNVYGGRADRSQSSSTNPNRGFGGLQSFSNLGLSSSGGWSAASGPIGTAGRASSTFSPAGYQESIFSPMGDVSSPGVFGGPGNTFGAIGRGSGKMSSLFPNPMQDHMRGDHGFGEVMQGRGGGMSSFGMPVRDSDSPSRIQRGPLDDLFNNLDARPRGSQGVSSPFAQEPLQRPDSSAQSSTQQAPSAVASATASGNSPPAQDSNQMPAAQKRQMVMPDRMRWIYRDPTGQTQGPWSGLEMHDWYKAGFFSPELLVKKQEDQEYEPLAQLIRRIGNSREPFLVPQIGIPHGPPTTQSGGALGLASTGSQTGAAQPPFPSSFPSFGTTLTAQQQNELERRKQEEQFLMARQKEQLAAHQAMMKTMQMSGMTHSMHQGLNHHSSAQSLHSQPSYSSITSPSGYQPSPGQMPIPHAGGMPGIFDRPGHPFGGFSGDVLPGRENELSGSLDRLNLGRSSHSPYANIPIQNQDPTHQQQVNLVLQDRARVQKEQEQAEALGQTQPNEIESKERLEQFQQLRTGDATDPSQQGGVGQPTDEEKVEIMPMPSVDAFPSEAQQGPLDESRGSSIPASDSVPTSMVPPPPPISPLPAPAAQRNRQHVAETLAADNRSRSQTPSIETPTAALAPWAKEIIEPARGPSLKEIQEAEAKQAAQREELAAAARRQVAEQERIIAANPQTQAVAGLPSGANWAANASPTAVAGASAWTKKAVVPAPVAGTKKTLAQIQKEEEARKNRAAAASTASSSNIATASTQSGGKRYADLASKGPGVVSSATGGAWTTVGAGGKPKIPVGPAASTPQRSVSGNVATVPSKPKAPTPVRAITSINSTAHAQEEFQKWVKAALGKGLNTGINVDEFVRNLMQLPAEAEMLADAVYASSQTLDGRRFAEEFIRRRKLADKGVAPEPNAGSGFAPGGSSLGDSKNTGGWSEVAKKSTQQQGQPEVAGYKMVVNKKKGKR